MVTQKPTCRFLGKVEGFFQAQTTPERHRSGVAHSTLWLRSYDAQEAAQVDSIGTILRPLINTFYPVICPKNIFHPGASCGFLEILHKNYFRAWKDPVRASL